MEVVSVVAREALIDSIAEALDACESSAFLHRDGQRLAVIAGSVKQAGVFQVSFFRRDGAGGDFSVKTLQEAVSQQGNPATSSIYPHAVQTASL